MSAVMVLWASMLSAQWGPDVRLTYDDSTSALRDVNWGNYWTVAASGSNVHVVWYDNRDGNYEIYYKRSTDNGETWGPDTRLTYTARPSLTPSIAVWNDIVHVTWREYLDSLCYMRSLDGGTTWEPSVRIGYGTADPPGIAVFRDTVFVAFDNYPSGFAIWYNYSTNSGLTWSGPISLYDWDQNWIGNCIHSTTGFWILFHSYDNGVEQTAVYLLRPDGSGWQFPFTEQTIWSLGVAGADSVIYVTWEEEGSYGPYIYFYRSTDGANSWLPGQILLETAQREHSMAASQSNVHFVYCSGGVNYNNLFYRHSTDYGATWLPDTQLTNSTFQDWGKRPSITTSGPYVHLVWMDSRDGNWEIYYKRKKENIGIEEQISPDAGRPKFLSAPSFFKDRILLKFTEPLKDHVKIEVYNIIGQRVFERVYPASSSITIADARLKKLAKGVYFLMVQSGNEDLGKVKLIKP
ncbi:MAG: T9SS type A sorting domain-containing protein [Candidatus Omnitrophica bacterium]|nr:T9SS type A sorting domain-containing protein [Candidatus Omnitrophota bacterium]